MHTHMILPWTPVSFEPRKKPAKPRKAFDTGEPEQTDVPQSRRRPESDLDEPEYQKTDILA